MYDVFISYRRDGGHEMARLLYEHFNANQIICFFDLEELGSGEFNLKLLQNIEESKNFVLILSPNALERCQNEGDWVRCEIEHAIKHNKNIVPLMLSGFEWPKELPTSLSKLPFYNGVSLVREYFNASLAKLIDLLILDKSTKSNPRKTDGYLGGVASWLERAFIFLEDADWKNADIYAEKVLDADPKNSEAYLVKLMAALRVARRGDLKKLEEPFDRSPAYKPLMRYADDTLKSEMQGYIEHIRVMQAKKLEDTYQKAIKMLSEAKTQTACKKASALFNSLFGYKDSVAKVRECQEKAEEILYEPRYLVAIALEEQGTGESLAQAATIFDSIGSYKNSFAKAKQSRALAEEIDKQEKYIKADILAKTDTQEELVQAISIFESICEYKDSAERAQACRTRVEENANEEKYLQAVALELKDRSDFLLQAAALFESIAKYKDSDERAKACRARVVEIQQTAKYNQAIVLEARDRYEDLLKAEEIFRSIGKYKDAAERASTCHARAIEIDNEEKYAHAVALASNGTRDCLLGAANIFESIRGFKDSAICAEKCHAQIEEINNKDKYAKAETFIEKDTVDALLQAAQLFFEIGGYKDATERAAKCRARADKKKRKKKIFAIFAATFSICIVIAFIITLVQILTLPEYTLQEDGTYAITGIGGFSGENLEIPETYRGVPVTSIGKGAFENCRKLISVTIPDSITEIHDGAFSGCENLDAVYIDNLEAWCKISFLGTGGFNPLSYARNFYVNKTLITDLVIPNGVTNIGSDAFHGASFRSVTIPESVTTIGDAAFRHCSSLTSITFGENSELTSIGNYVFYECDSLTSITFGGTKAQWERVSKDRHWADPPPTITVTCTDGAYSTKY